MKIKLFPLRFWTIDLSATMEDSSSAQSLTHLPNKLAFSLCLFKCLTIPSLLYASFSSVLSEDNVLVTHSIPVLKCVVIFNFVSWMSLTLLTWFKTNSTTGKSKIKLGVMLKVRLSVVTYMSQVSTFLIEQETACKILSYLMHY